MHRGRRALLVGTALQATTILVLALPANAQPSPNAQPQGGHVVAGSAVISQNPTTTTITQSTQRAAVNWNNFNVGSNQTVNFAQPTSTASTLNRVNSPDPSQIAGHIQANGTIILVNPNGVVFDQGSQVNVAALVVSTAGISNKNFMAGKLAFDKPGNPNAAVVNQGNITIKDAGLAALVAPQVVNSGVINARLGHVVVAGVKEATLDLYGDGMVAIDVAKSVTQAPIGLDGKPVTALVTNTGTIRADGGTVQLTARAVDGVVQNLVTNNGLVAADSVGTRSGKVLFSGIGGSVVVTGTMTASGTTPDSMGGAIGVNATGSVTLAPGARLDASGPAGGGVVAVGTTLKRAQSGPGVIAKHTAANVTVQQGAVIAANATAKGNGGKVTVLATGTTVMNGTISATGGSMGGDGGFVETSGKGFLDIGPTASVTAAAPQGHAGSWLLDPDSDIDITTATANVSCSAGVCSPTADSSTLDAATIATSLNGGTSVTVTTSNPSGTQSGNITVDSQIALTAAKTVSLTLDAGAGGGAGAITLNQPITDAGSGGALSLILNAGGGITFNNTVSLGGSLAATAGTIAAGDITTGTAGFLKVSGLASFTNSSTDGLITVHGTTVSELTGGVVFNTTGTAGNVILANDGGASGTVLGTSTINGTGSIEATTGGITQTGVLTITGAAAFATDTANQTITLNTQTNALSGGVTIGTTGASGNAILKNSGGTSLRGLGVGGTFSLEDTTGSISQLSTGLQVSGTASFTTDATGKTITLDDSLNRFATVSFNTTGSGADVLLLNKQDLTFGASSIGGSLTGTITSSGSITTSGSISAGGTISLTAAGTGNGVIINNPISGSSFSATAGSGGTVTLNVASPTVAVTTSGGGQTYNNAVTLTADTMLSDSGSGGINFVGNVDGAHALNVNAGSGAIGFEAAVGSGTPLTSLTATSTGALTFAGNVKTSGTQTYNGGVEIFNSVTFDSSAGNGAITFTGLVEESGPQNLVLSSGSGALTLAGVTVQNLTLTTTGVVTLNTGNYSLSGPYVFPAVTTNGTLGMVQATTFGNITLGSATTIDSSSLNKNLNFGKIDGGPTLVVNAGTGVVTLGGAVGSSAPLTSLSITSDPTISASVTTSGGGQSYNGPVSLGATVTLKDTGGGALALNGQVAGGGNSLTLSTTGTETLSGVTTTGNLTLGTPASLILNAGTYTITGGANPYVFPGVATTLNGTLTLGQATNFGGAVTLGSNTTTDSSAVNGAIDFASTVNGSTSGGQNLTVNAGTATVTLGGAVGGTNPLLNFNATGGTLSLGGGIAANGTLTLDSTGLGALTLPFNLNGGTVNLLSGGAVSQSGGSITAGTLVGTVASAALTQASNAVAILGTFTSTGSFALTDAGSLAATGSITAANMTLNAGTIGITGILNGGTVVTFGATAGGVSQAATSSINAATLTSNGTAAGGITLAGTANTIGTLLTVNTTGLLKIIDDQSLALAGTSSVGGTGTVDLTTIGSSSNLTQPSGALTAGTLTSSGGIGGNVSLTTGSNQIGTIDNFAAGGTLTLFNNNTLSMAGTVTAPTIALVTTGVTIDGTVNASSKLTVRADNGLAEIAAGVINTPTLATSATINGDITLIGTANTIGAFGNLAYKGTLNVLDTSALTLNGSVGGASATSSTFAPASLTIASGGVINVGTVAINTTAGGVTEQGTGSIVTNSLSITTTGAGDVSLESTTNQIGTSTGIQVANGNLILVDDPTLLLTGPHSANNLFIEVNAAGGTIQVGSSIIGAALTATAVSNPRISLVADNIAAGTASSSITASGGSVELAPFSSGGLISLGGGVSQVVDAAIFGELSTGTVLIGQFTDVPNGSTLSTTAGTIAIGGAVNLTGHAGTLDLVTSGAVTETGTLIAGTLTGSAASVSLTQGSDQVGTLAAFTTTGGFALTNNQSLTVAGVLSDSGSGQSVALTTKTGGITIAGNVSAASDTVSIVSAGTVSQTGGIITATTLAGSSVGGATLTDSNKVGTFGSFANTASGTLNFTDAQALATAGTLSSAGNILLTTTGVGSNLTLGGTISAPGNTATLISAGTIGQTAGIITVGTLTGSTAASASLTSGNKIGTLGAFTTSTGFGLTNAQSLTVGGTVSDSGNGQTVALQTTSGDITLAGNVTAANDTLNIISAGSIGQSGGSLTATTLNGSAATSASFGQGNLIGTLAAFAVATGFTLTNSQSLTVAGALTDSGVGQTMALTATSGNISFTGNVTATGDTLDILSAGSIGQGGGSITVATLTGSAAATASFGQSSNVIGTLAAFTATSFTLDDSRSLALNGTLAATSADLVVAGSITQPGGMLNVGTLSGSATGSASLAQAANLVGILGAFSASSFSLTDNESVALNGTISATSATLVTNGSISQSSGAVNVGTLTGSSIGGLTLSGSNAIGTFGGFSNTGSSGISVNDAQSLATTGAITSTGAIVLQTAANLTLGGNINAPGGAVTLVAAGAISQLSGIITAGTLTGSSSGGAILTDNNAVGTFGNFANATSGALSFTDAQALGTTGTISSGDNVTLTAAGLTLGGNISAPAGSVDLVSSGTINQASGIVTASALTGSSIGGATLNDGNAVGTFGGFASATSGALSFTDAQALSTVGTINSAGAITLTATSLTLGGNITTPGNTVNLVSAGTIDQTGGVIAASVLTGSSSGGAILAGSNAVTIFGGFTNAGSGLLSFTDAQALSTAGAISSAGDILLATTGGGSNLTLNGAVSTPGNVTLNSSGTIQQAAGIITAAAFAGSSIGGASLTGSNAVGSFGNFNATGGALSFTDAQALTTTGSVSAGSNILLTTTVPGSSLTLGGAVSAPGTITLVSTGSISESGGGRIANGTLVGSSAGNANLTGGNTINTLGSFSANGGTFNLTNAANLTIVGPLTASAVTVNDGLQTTTLSAGNIAGGPGNVTFIAGDVNQTGVTTIGSFGTLTVNVSANSAGTIALATLASGNTALVLDLGSSGHANSTDLINVQALTLNALRGENGGASLFGTVNTVTGQAAAGRAHMNPTPNSHYELNNCPIQSVNCVIVPVQLLPVLRPINTLFFEVPPLPTDDPDLIFIMPNVWKRDY